MTSAPCRALLCLALGSLALGCLGRDRSSRGDDDEEEGGEPKDVGDEGPVDGAGDLPPPGEDPPVVDEPPPDDPGEQDPPEDPPVDERGAYPGGPYGVWNGDTLRNYSFLTGSGTITLEDVRRDASHDVLLLYLGSASCAYCGVESPELNTIYATYEEQGLEIFGVLSDEAGGPPTGASADRYFGEEHDAVYPYGANEWADGTLMTDLYPDGNVALPMNFMIDLETMEILERMDGYPDPGGMTPIVASYF